MHRRDHGCPLYDLGREQGPQHCVVLRSGPLSAIRPTLCWPEVPILFGCCKPRSRKLKRRSRIFVIFLPRERPGSLVEPPGSAQRWDHGVRTTSSSKRPQRHPRRTGSLPMAPDTTQSPARPRPSVHAESSRCRPFPAPRRCCRKIATDVQPGPEQRSSFFLRRTSGRTSKGAGMRAAGDVNRDVSPLSESTARARWTSEAGRAGGHRNCQ